MASAFLSYSHDSEAHKTRVIELAIRLRNEGVEAMLDQWEENPPEGWPRWMINQIQNSDFVLIVYTKGYFEKIAQTGPAKKGLGARAEDQLITQQIYEAGGFNDKFIPIILGQADEQYIPAYLRPYTRYLLPAEYEKLYRWLTRQPKSVPPPLGKIKKLEQDGEPVAAGALADQPIPNDVLIQDTRGGGAFYGNYDSITQAGKTLAIDIVSSDDEAIAELQRIGRNRNELIVSYGVACKIGTVVRFENVLRKGIQTISITINLHEVSNIMEVNLGNMTADELATIRARRILLNQHLPSKVTGPDINEMTREVFIRKNGGMGQIEDCVLARIAKVAGINSASMAYGKLAAVADLILSGTVESIERLEIMPVDDKRIRVRFSGQRHKFYSNKPPTRIAFEDKGELLS